MSSFYKTFLSSAYLQKSHCKIPANYTPDFKLQEENNHPKFNTHNHKQDDQSQLSGGNKKKILIIEDSVKLRTILIQILSENYVVVGLCDASHALEQCEQIKPDIILLDIMLPGSIDGLSFLRIIKQDKHLTHIPVILMSLLSTDGIILEGLKLGANDYIVKPFDIRQLDLKIKNYIHLNQQMREKMLMEQNIHFEVRNDSPDVLKKFELLLENTIMTYADMTIENYAQQLNMSLSTLERVIKKNFNTSPTKYILQRKLEKADILIRSNQRMSIKEISLTLGFSSLSYFCRCYKNYYGKSPSSGKELSNQ